MERKHLVRIPGKNSSVQEGSFLIEMSSNDCFVIPRMHYPNVRS